MGSPGSHAFHFDVQSSSGPWRGQPETAQESILRMLNFRNPAGLRSLSVDIMQGSSHVTGGRGETIPVDIV